MNNQHLIDNAVFDTTYSDKAVALERRPEIDDFVKSHLMNVIDEVFNKIERDSGNPDCVLRINKLEIDLGDIPYRDYRRQMSEKLRERLLSALHEARYSTTKKPLSSPGPVDSKSDAQAQLFYFLRNGYLPWYSRLTGERSLESLLNETIDSAPVTFVEFMRDNVHRASVLERLAKQFSKPTLQRVMKLPAFPDTPEDGRAINVDNLQAQLVLALYSGDVVFTERAWQPLYVEHPQRLEAILRHYGQQAVVRHNIAFGFSPALFSQLLRLLAPAAHDFVQILIDHADLFQPDEERLADGRSRLITVLREFTLAYLLVEPANRFSRKTYLAGLLRQLSASNDRIQSLLLARLMENKDRLFASHKLAGDMSLLLSALAAEITARDPPSNETATRVITDEDSSVCEETTRITTDGDLPSGETATRIATDADLPSGETASRIATDGDLPSDETASRITTDEGSPLRDNTDQILSGKGTLSSEAGYRAGPDEHYQRLVSALTKAGAAGERGDSGVLEDIKKLARDTPHLLTRLFRELQADSYPWRQVLETLSTPVLAELSYAFLSSNKRSGEAISSESGSDLLSAVHSNAQKSQDQHAFFIHILNCLIKDEVIDFNVLETDPSLPLKPEDRSSERAYAVDKAEHLRGNTPASTTSAAAEQGESLQAQDEEPALRENIYIANAGAVLFAPYLPRLFERLGLVDHGRFKNRDAAEYGVHCVQFLVNESISSPEYLLVLNKLLCGVKPGLPIRRSIALTVGEQEQLEALLHAITQHWKPLANTSITGLRESFLQRNGRLQLKSDAWHLSVEARPFDMLLDQVPWSYSTIKFPWMDRVIYVEWR